MSAGLATIWLCVETEGFSIDSFILAPEGDLIVPTSGPTVLPTVPETPAPVVDVGGAYEGVAALVPGVIQAEEFDEGGEGVGYSDTDSENNGGVSLIRVYTRGKMIFRTFF